MKQNTPVESVLETVEFLIKTKLSETSKGHLFVNINSTLRKSINFN